MAGLTFQTKEGLILSKIIAVANQKGGVGKTTTTVNLAACIANAGKRVLMVDMDPQGNASSGVGIKAGKNTVYEVLLGECTMQSVIVPTVQKNLSVAPVDIRLAGAEVELVSMQRREYRMRAALESVKDQFDFIFIDCPPSLGLLTINALAAAQTVLVPIQCEYYALEGVTALMNTISRVKKGINPHLDVEGILLTMLDGRTNLGLQVVAQVKKHFKNKHQLTAGLQYSVNLFQVIELVRPEVICLNSSYLVKHIVVKRNL